MRRSADPITERVASTRGWEARRVELTATSRLLWGVAPPLHAADGLASPGHRVDDNRDGHEDDPPRLSLRGLQLPPHLEVPSDADAATAYRAAVAHAGAHLAHSTPGQDPRGLKPITIALIGLLEDARVESLACTEMPGLRRLWAPFHREAIDAVADFETLLCRLARALLLPDALDPHPWVGKGRRLFFGDADRAGLIGEPSSLRQVASLLGNDIGQMRLSFNAKTYRVQPSYRDDNQWLWQPQAGAPTEALAAAAAEESKASGPPDNAPHSEPATPQATAAEVARSEPLSLSPSLTVHHYPEWDRLIARSRAQWARVLDHAADPRDAVAEPSPARAAAARALRDRANAWRRSAPPAAEPPMLRLPRQADGDSFDLAAVVEARLALRSGRWPDERVYQGRERRRADALTLCLLDLSTSTAAGVVSGQGSAGSPADTQLDQARIAALAEALADHKASRGERSGCAVHGFWSVGRHQVHYQRIKAFDEPIDDCVLDRLLGLRPQGSTRLGAALRHATVLLLARPASQRSLLVVSDGDAHDIDIHDPRYLIEDACRAVHEARAQGIAVHCLVPGAAPAPAARAVFGQNAVQFARPAAV